MARRRRSSGLVLLLRIGAVVWVIAMAALAVVLVAQGAVDAARWAPVIAALTSLAAFATPLGERVFKRLTGRAAGTADGVDLGDIADHLAKAVEAQWRAEARVRRLQDPWPLPVRWMAAARDLADHDELVFGSQGAGWSTGGWMADAADVFETLPYRRLVVLGEPGAGKSVFAMSFLLAMQDRRVAGGAVPVLFPVGGWDPSRISLNDWMVDYLAENYQLAGVADTAGTARELVAGGRLLPVLDGLDELPPALRPVGIREVNRSLDRSASMVLTSRIAEFREAVEAGDVLTQAAVVQLQPLDVETTIDYLRATTPSGPRLDRWVPVFDRIRAQPDGPLAVVLTTPLMAGLARTVYGDSPDDPARLLDPALGGRDPLEQHLLDSLIPATYLDSPRLRERGRAVWHAADVTAWLTYLARSTGAPGLPDLAWWRLELVLTRLPYLIVGGLLIGGVLATIFGPVVAAVLAVAGILAGWASRGDPPTVERWIGRPLQRWMSADRTHRQAIERVVAAAFGHGSRLPAERKLALAAGRLAAIGAGLGYGLLNYPAAGLYPVVADGLAVALAVGLTLGPVLVAPRTTLSEVHLSTRRGGSAFLQRLAVGGMIGLVGGAVFGAFLNSRFGVVVGVVVGLALGLVDGLNIWLDVATDVTRALSPGSTRRAERTAAIARGATVALAVGLGAGSAFTLAYGWESGVWHGLLLGVGYGLADQYEGVVPTVWGRYVIAKASLALAGHLPWRLMTFLEDAYRRGLLRRAGATYEFRHVRLRDRLATR